MAIEEKSLIRNLRTVSKKTGVYFFLDRNGKLLYIGKAVNIQNRIRSHFANKDTTSPAKAKLLKETRSIRWELCSSEPEALIREAELIKKLKPRYNVLLRDDKNYLFVGITKEKFPKVFLTHQPAGHGTRFSGKAGSGSARQVSRYVGPFTDGNSLKRVLKYLRKALPYCTCRSLHNRECLSGTLGRCLGICCLKPEYCQFSRSGKLTVLRF